jgi:hypothetical protein
MNGLPAWWGRRPVGVALAIPALLAVAQQQLLLQRPPRLEHLHGAQASSGPAALQARFSRPMATDSLNRSSRLRPPLAHRWLGQGNSLLLSLEPRQRISAPLRLDLAGRDNRGLALAASQWFWDPRPRIVAVVSRTDGDQVQLRDHDGRWLPLSPVWPEIPVLLPLGDGSGLAAASRQADGQLRLWRIPLQQHNLHPVGRSGMPPRAGRAQALLPGPVLFAHLSSNRNGDLLLQSGGLEPGSGEAMLLLAGGGRRALPWRVSGPMQLLPEGGAAVVPGPEGLHLRSLPPLPPRSQTLPGSRDLSSFCPQAGRALLLRHWPDFRRSLELVEPGLPPRQLWLGPEALLASACDRNGERVWLLLAEGSGQPRLRLLALDRQGRRLAERQLEGWELEPGTGLHWDPATGRLLAALRPLTAGTAGPPAARAVLIDADSLRLQPLLQSVRQVYWLAPG